MYPDDRDTTVADRRAYASYAESERQKDFQSVDVSFPEEEPRPSSGPVA
jgi:membrane protein